MDGSVNGTNPHLLESLGRKSAFGKEAVAQIARRIDIGGIVHMPVGVDIRPADLVRSEIFTHHIQPGMNLFFFLFFVIAFPLDSVSIFLLFFIACISFSIFGTALSGTDDHRAKNSHKDATSNNGTTMTYILSVSRIASFGIPNHFSP